MAEYVDAATVKKRATANGWRYIADRDHDGALNTTETNEVEYAIQWAGRRIDKVLTPFIKPSEARGQGNDYLQDLCLDLAVYRLFTNGGDDAPQSIQAAFDDAQNELNSIKGGESVPGLTFIHPRPTTTSAKVPRAYMPR